MSEPDHIVVFGDVLPKRNLPTTVVGPDACLTVSGLMEDAT